MLVKTRYLIEGCILSKESRGLSKRPIMYEKTILTTRLIEALQAILITEVSVDETLIDGKKFLPKESIDQELDEMEESSDFTDLYLKSVQTYKRLFKNWQAGSKVEVVMVRSIMIPLMDKALEEPGNILMLYHSVADVFHAMTSERAYREKQSPFKVLEIFYMMILVNLILG
ncbi:hypothetical protein [Bacillus sp. ISL-34]|uniref:hypothetical protein n=1 Tax=Bacillus sp. ISL-34 TaxID=2819121 RepID=UPI00257053DF|nr:hypothetical protein [Bacillus sp. ISL-34]